MRESMDFKCKCIVTTNIRYSYLSFGLEVGGRREVEKLRERQRERERPSAAANPLCGAAMEGCKKGFNQRLNKRSKPVGIRRVFKQFHKVSLAKIAIMSDILQAHEVWKILLWR